MNSQFPDIPSLLQTALKEELYEKLILQLNKDFNYANIPVDFKEDLKPEQLKRELHEVLCRLILEKFADYLNLLYIIDVSEEQVKKLDGEDAVVISEQVAFLVLKREWLKVWFKNRYK
ncbi:hypothetical protein GWK08_04795 [Leptobacterium flavescens]|uniref:Uncharacterized protein n=1 Tax=Leptobacterium flavescens TaxID=472055 RepID=A0A6P0UIC2_9FLAO|nr:hypothetical protein [Leptobacterium flavescens]NER12747.1 hypothetical protein [Leptobacterium flavescens]